MKVEDSLLDKDNTATVMLPRSPETDTVNWPTAGTQCICKGWGCTSEGKYFRYNCAECKCEHEMRTIRNTQITKALS